MAVLPATSPERLYAFTPRFPEVRPTFDAENERQYRRSVAEAFLALSVKPNPARPYLYAVDYGVIGDGTTDDTLAMQAALDDGAAQSKVVYAGALIVMISSALSMSGPGLLFDDCAFGVAGEPGILVTGTGYTALTVTGRPSCMNVCVYGTGNTANGIYFNNPILAHIHSLRVHDLDGFGVKIDKGYDMLFGTTSIESCGNTSQYAFSVNDAGDTSNMSHFLRIQVELATAKAINIDANTLCCIFDDIHSEQATASVGSTTWVLGGHACHYNTVRLAANVTAPKASAHLISADSTWTKLFTESSVDVTVEATVGVEETVMTLLSPRVQGTFAVVTNQQGKIQIDGGNITDFTSDAAYFRVSNCLIKTLTLGFTANPPDDRMARFVNCDIGTLVSNSSLAAATFIGCQISEGNSLLRGATTLIDSSVTCAATIAHSSGTLKAINSTITGAISYTNNAAIRLSSFSRVTGTISCGDGGNVDFLCDDTSTIGSASTGVGVPTGGAHVIGDRHRNPLPTTTGTTAWVCTTAGTPGTFTAEGTVGGSSTADSKADSASVRASTADSKALSVSLLASTADSKGVSAGARASTADSKAVSDALHCSNVDSRLTSAGF